MQNISVELNYLPIAPRKVRLVANLLRGMAVERARQELRHLPKRSSKPLEKLLVSAIANAKNNFQLDSSPLYIEKIQVNAGPVKKRFMPRAFGRAATIRKRTSHVMLVLGVRGEVLQKVSAAKKKPDVALREVKPEELREEADIPLKKVERKALDQVRPAPRKGFMKKIFQRKAI